MGYLKYGYYETEIDLTEEEYEDFKADPMKYISENPELTYDAELKVTNWVVNDCGQIWDVEYEEMED